MQQWHSSQTHPTSRPEVLSFKKEFSAKFFFVQKRDSSDFELNSKPNLALKEFEFDTFMRLQSSGSSLEQEQDLPERQKVARLANLFSSQNIKTRSKSKKFWKLKCSWSSYQRILTLIKINLSIFVISKVASKSDSRFYRISGLSSAKRRISVVAGVKFLLTACLRPEIAESGQKKSPDFAIRIDSRLCWIDFLFRQPNYVQIKFRFCSGISSILIARVFHFHDRSIPKASSGPNSLRKSEKQTRWHILSSKL